TRVPKKDTGKYGIAIGRKIGERTYKLDAFIEKPKAGETSSCMAAAGKNIITPSVINHLRKVKRKDGEELRLADAFILALAKGEAIYGHEHDGELFDCGSKLGFLNATVAYGLEHPETKDAFRKYLKAKLKD
ncbi:MAG: UTP--glucose-1-phosphate uridylyltransferase, partial [Candidatus Vogelbacteria bacterium CG10_big_fil_rev_8_21_14_0_10_45_14]